MSTRNPIFFLWFILEVTTTKEEVACGQSLSCFRVGGRLFSLGGSLQLYRNVFRIDLLQERDIRT